MWRATFRHLSGHITLFAKVGLSKHAVTTSSGQFRRGSACPGAQATEAPGGDRLEGGRTPRHGEGTAPPCRRGVLACSCGHDLGFPCVCVCEPARLHACVCLNLCPCHCLRLCLCRCLCRFHGLRAGDTGPTAGPSPATMVRCARRASATSATANVHKQSGSQAPDRQKGRGEKNKTRGMSSGLWRPVALRRAPTPGGTISRKAAV